MTIFLIFITWFILGTFIGTFLANKRRRPQWTLGDDWRFWQNLVRKQ